MRWLCEGVKLSTTVGMDGLKLLLDSADNQRKLLLDATRKLRQLSRSEKYASDYELLRSVPGIGMITAMSLQKEEVIRYKGSDTQVVDVILPDGSSVNLFPKSNLEYCFKNNKRDVVLVGKAFFEVKRDTLHPFLVQIPDVNVEVLGTSFLIDAIQPDWSAVFVKDGVVKVCAYDQEEILKSNQKVSLIKNNALYRDTILNTAIFELEQPVISLSFNRTPLKAVIEEIEKSYNVTIELRNIPEGNMITTAFYENSIDEVMNELSSLCHLKYAKISDRYFVFYTER